MGNNSYRFVLEPVIKMNGDYHSWELLTKNFSKKIDRYDNNDDFSFSALSEKEKIKIFEKQIEVLSGFDLAIVKNKTISLNVDDLLSDHILNDKYIFDFLLSNENISLEINEFFHEFKCVGPLTELTALAVACPIWLDDFGSGYTEFSLLERFKFDCVKIDKDYFWQNETNPALVDLLRSILTLSDSMIIEGVETKQQERFIHTIGDIACQGRLWSQYYYNFEC